MNEANGRLSPGEDALRLILDTTPALIHTGPPDGYLDYFNRPWLVFVGKLPEELNGWRWTDSVHSEDVAGLVQKWQAALASGEPLETEARVRRADAPKSPTKRVLPSARPATDSMRQLVIPSVWRIDYWSPELYKILGFDPSDGIPVLPDYLKVVHPDDRSIVEKTLEKMIAEGIGCDIKQRIVRTDGELRVIRCVSVPVVNDEKVVRFVGTLMDITEQETLTQELRRSEFYLQEGERLARMGSWSLKPDGSADY